MYLPCLRDAVGGGSSGVSWLFTVMWFAASNVPEYPISLTVGGAEGIWWWIGVGEFAWGVRSQWRGSATRVVFLRVLPWCSGPPSVVTMTSVLLSIAGMLSLIEKSE